MPLPSNSSSRGIPIFIGVNAPAPAAMMMVPTVLTDKSLLVGHSALGIGHSALSGKLFNRQESPRLQQAKHLQSCGSCLPGVRRRTRVWRERLYAHRGLALDRQA